MQVKISQAIRMIPKYLKAGLVPMLVGSPGCGKSDIIHQIAKEYKLQVIDLRLSQCDPTDLLGFPTVTGSKADYVPMKTFPIEGDPVPNDYNGWLLFLDEFNGAPISVQKAAYKLVLDKMVGSHKLHKNVAICCAGNLDTDNAAVEVMSTALQSRLVHMELLVDTQEFINYANEMGFDHRISSYLDFKPGNVYTFKPDHTDNTYACPRTWEFTNRILQNEAIEDTDALPMLAGAISEGIAREFLGFCKIENSLPKVAQIVVAPETISVPIEPSILYALTGSLSHNATEANFAQLMKFILRMPTEFQVVCLRGTIRRNKALLSHPAVQNWITSSAATLF